MNDYKRSFHATALRRKFKVEMASFRDPRNLLTMRAAAGADEAPAGLRLQYDKPAANWMTEALPIGNGRLGTMIFGGIGREHIQFNEDSLWTGDENDTGTYQAFGDVYIDLSHGGKTDAGFRAAPAAEAANYDRFSSRPLGRRHAMRKILYCVGLVIAGYLSAVPARADRMANPFYVMDTAFAPPFRHPNMTPGESFDMIRQMGFAGVGWTEKAPSDVNADVEELEKRGMKMYAIYFQGEIAPNGQLTVSQRLPAIMDVLKGHDTLIWLHISGKGPDFDTLTAQSPAVVKLRSLAEAAKIRGLKIALYPHLGEWIQKFGDALRLARLVDHPNLGVSFNLCHCLATGDEANIPALLTEARPVLLTVTICGADSGVDRSEKDIWKKLIQPLGQGTYDVRIVLNKLREINFTGPIGFQGYGISGEPRAILDPTIAAWRKLSGQEK